MTLGTVTPGVPMTHFPIIASLFEVGLGIGPLVAYLTAWSLFGLQRIIMWEIPFSGQSRGGTICREFFLSVPTSWLCEMLWEKLRV